MAGADRKKTIGHEYGGLLKAYDKASVLKMLFYPLIFVSLALPNIIYSGTSWFDTLHIMKWAWSMIPVAVISLIGGVMLAVYGSERTGLRLDFFGAVWLAIFAFISLQPLWADIFSYSTYMKEWYFFAVLIAAYIFSYNLFDSERALRAVLWLANMNAAVNIVFAELLIRDMNGICPLIMNVPGNYIGNTGQQEMFGLWMAMAALNGVFLHTVYSGSQCGGRGAAKIKYANLLLLAFNAWGLWNSTTRAGVLALVTGAAVLSLIFCFGGRKRLVRQIGVACAVIIAVLGLNLATGIFGWSRAYSLITKTSDMVMNTSNFGARREIWLTSWNVFKLHPIGGVGLGHYKWHYLDGQREALKTHPEMKWQFTYWAHSEYLQWLAELGIFGAAALLGAGAWWLWSFVRALAARKELVPSAAWGCSMAFLIWFDAIFSRPFHRIENAVWLSLAFALANRAILPAPPNMSDKWGSRVLRFFGIFMAAVSLSGIIFFCSGCRADKYLRVSTLTNSASLQAYCINEARRSLMARDEAEERLAYHLLAVAEATGSEEDLEKGVKQLYRSFKIRPQAKQLMELLNLAQKTGDAVLFSELVSYLHPNSYDLVPFSSDNSEK